MGMEVIAVVTIFAVVAGVLMAPGAQKPVALKDENVPEDDLLSGFGSTPIGSSAPIPVHLGRVMVQGNIIKAHLLGDNNSRLLMSLAVGEHLPLIDPILLDLTIGGVKFTDLTNYSAAPADLKSWFKFSPDGSDLPVFVSNKGRKVVNAQVSGNSEFVTAPIQMYGSSDIEVNLNHYAPKAGSTHTYQLYYKIEIGGPWVSLGSYSEFFQKLIPQEVPDGKDTKTVWIPVESWTKRAYAFTVPDGQLYFRLVTQGVTNGGTINFDNVDILSDEGQEVSFKSPGTTFLLVNVQKTEEVSSIRFGIEVEYPYGNAVDALKFLLTDPDFGLNVPDIYIDNASFTEASQYSDSIGSRIALSISNMQYDSAIQKILTAEGMYLSRTGGVFKIFHDIDSAPVSSIDILSDIIPGTFNWGINDYQSEYNRLRAKFADKDDNYSLTDLIVEDLTRVDLDGYVRETTVDLTPIRFMGRAQERAELIYKQGLLNNVWCKFKIGIKKSGVEVGDIVQIVNDDIGWDIYSDKYFRIMSMDESLGDEGLFGHSVSAVLHDPNVYLQDYDWDIWVPEPEFPLDGNSAELGFPKIQASDISEKIVSMSNGVYQSNIVIRYDNPVGYEITGVVIYGRPGYSTDYVSFGYFELEINPITIPNIETYAMWEFNIAAVILDLGQQPVSDTIFSSFYPTLQPYSSPGYGGGYYSIQPYGA